jgi:hypothetical protein
MIQLHVGACWGINHGTLAAPHENNIIKLDMGPVKSSTPPTPLSPIPLLSDAKEA